MRLASRHSLSTRPLALVSALGLLTLACGSSSDHAAKAPAAPADGASPPSSTPSTPEQGTPPPPGATAAGDHGAPSDTYPAFTPSMPQVINNGGDVLKSPTIVTVTFKGETDAAALETFGDMIGASSYWKQVATEYGVGAATSGAKNHVRLKTTMTLPAKVSDADIAAFVGARIKDKTFPANAPGTIYALYLPRGTAITDVFGDECPGDVGGTGGYHSSAKIDGANVVYAVMAQCEGSTLDDNTVTASHEFGEASVDPYVGDDDTLAWVGLRDTSDFAWDYFMGYQDETADMCEFEPDQYDYEHDDLPFLVQRQWSNAAAAAGKSPCVPAPPGAFFQLALLEPLDTLIGTFPDEDGAPADTPLGGIRVDVGSSRTVAFGFNSDRPSAPWSVGAKEIEINEEDGSILDVPEADRSLALTFDKDSGRNGEKTYLKIDFLKDTAVKAHLVVIESKLGDAVHQLPIFVGATPAPALRAAAPRVFGARRPAHAPR